LVPIEINAIKVEGTIQSILSERLLMELPLVVGVRGDTGCSRVALNPNTNSPCRTHVELPEFAFLRVRDIEKALEMVPNDLWGVWGIEELPIERFNQSGLRI
jgi:hypothetical protein